jgi:hypothetical protein
MSSGYGDKVNFALIEPPYGSSYNKSMKKTDQGCSNNIDYKGLYKQDIKNRA